MLPFFRRERCDFDLGADPRGFVREVDLRVVEGLAFFGVVDLLDGQDRVVQLGAKRIHIFLRGLDRVDFAVRAGNRDAVSSKRCVYRALQNLLGDWHDRDWHDGVLERVGAAIDEADALNHVNRFGGANHQLVLLVLVRQPRGEAEDLAGDLAPLHGFGGADRPIQRRKVRLIRAKILAQKGASAALGIHDAVHDQRLDRFTHGQARGVKMGRQPFLARQQVAWGVMAAGEHFFQFFRNFLIFVHVVHLLFCGGR